MTAFVDVGFKQVQEYLGRSRTLWGRRGASDLLLHASDAAGQFSHRASQLGMSDIVKTKFEGTGTKEKKGKVLLGTVAGDVHDIGKNIVSFMLDANGFEVIDLGVDVPKETFVEKIAEHEPQVIGMSALLTLAFEPMKEAISAIEAE